MTFASRSDKPVAAPPFGAASSPVIAPQSPEIRGVAETLADLAQDLTLPKNFRKGAQTALEELRKDGVDVDVRVATAVSILDDLANDSNLPVHGRTSLWSVISRLESLP